MRRRTGPHHVGTDDAGLADPGNENVRATSVQGKVGDGGVEDRDGRIGSLTLAAEQKGERTAEGWAATQNDDVATGGGDAVVQQHGADPGRCCRYGTRQSERESADVGGMESVGILAPIQFEQGGGKAQVRRERVLDQDSVNGRVRIEAFRRPTRTGFQ